MNDERKRIEKMLAEGRITQEEADGLLAALDKSKKREKVLPPEQIEKPRLSTLALLGALGLPAAGVVFLIVTGIGLIFAEGVYAEHRAIDAGALVAAAVAITGIILSIAGLITIRSNPDKLRGRKLALAGILVPVVLFAAGVALSLIMWLQWEAHVQETRNRMTLQMYASKDECEIDELLNRFEHEIPELARALSEEDHERFIEVVREFLEPGWVEDLGKQGTKVGEKTLLGIMPLNELANFLDAVEHPQVRIPANSSIDEMDLSAYGEDDDEKLLSLMDKGVVILSDGVTELRVPVVKVKKEWYFAKGKVTITNVGRSE